MLGPEDKVCLPVHFRLLHEHTERRMSRGNGAFLARRGTHAAGESRPSCVGSSFEAAKEIFKLANHCFSRALEYFLLDGWVTEHVRRLIQRNFRGLDRILQELAMMYRTLQFWEEVAKRSFWKMTLGSKEVCCHAAAASGGPVAVSQWAQS